ncbi:MAG: efflux transporter periplasmic adaptor subunit, partial [Odoribacter sp.]|nr:efflux transporter periplasmic adaptor subunit [Odoribacter sp.]
MMKLLIMASVMMLSICFYGCKHTEKHNHEATEAHSHESKHAHNHEGHKHSHEGHAHDAAGHHHEEEEHHHEAEGSHSDEIIFTKAQAAKTDFKVEEIQPGIFHQVIKTTGQVLPA